MSFSIKKIIPHLLVLVGFVILSLAYFSPVLKGKQIFQSDIMHYIGMSKQQKDFKAQTGEETYWTNSAFGGMPTYQLGAKYPHNYIKKLDLTLRFLPRPADYLFLYFLGFYILMLSLKLDFKLAALGALAFGFSTYLVIILGVGHNSKAHAIAYMPLVLSGIILTFRKQYILGFLLTAIAMGLELVANHFQMTYYLLLLVLVLGIAYLVDAYRKQMLPHFFKSVGILSLAVILAIGLNATNIMATQEYAKESTRGKSELTINADGLPKEASSGLSKEYITEYSYGILETFNLYIPRFMGGGMREDVGGKDSNVYKFLRSRNVPPSQALGMAKEAPAYWGQQPIVEAPAYVGATVLFLFVLALFLVKGRLKWWLVGGTIFSLLLSYGKNLGFLTNFFIDDVPLYNKFRAVSSIQVILELCIPVLAIFGVSRLFNDFEQKDDKQKALLYSIGITAGIALLFVLFKSVFFNFSGASDALIRQNYGQEFLTALKEDRQSIFTSDTLRSLVLVLLSGGVIFAFLKEKLSETLTIIALGVLIVFDLVIVDRRYVNSDNFMSALQVEKPYQANGADAQILKDTSHFRVFDITSGGARASYFHNSLSGYHAAKLGRYDELFNFHIVKNNPEVINMLNAKYVITQDEKGQPYPYLNEEANGNAWFVTDLKPVASADEEIKALAKLKTKQVAITSDKNISSQSFVVDSLASIQLTEYKPNYLKYESNNANKGLAVFSEVYYKNGWQSFIDGQPASHFRADYVLRAIEVPKGKHTIEFKFEPEVIKTGSTIALTSSVLLGLLLLGGLFFQFRASKTEA